MPQKDSPDVRLHLRPTTDRVRLRADLGIEDKGRGLCIAVLLATEELIEGREGGRALDQARQHAVWEAIQPNMAQLRSAACRIRVQDLSSSIQQESGRNEAS